jgi:hypothetical protein
VGRVTKEEEDAFVGTGFARHKRIANTIRYTHFFIGNLLVSKEPVSFVSHAISVFTLP